MQPSLTARGSVSWIHVQMGAMLLLYGRWMAKITPVWPCALEQVSWSCESLCGWAGGVVHGAMAQQWVALRTGRAYAVATVHMCAHYGPS